MVMTVTNVLTHLSCKYGGDWKKIYEAIAQKEAISDAEGSKNAMYLQNLSQAGIKFMTIIDNDYPSILKDKPQPPFVIYYKGNKELIQKDVANKLVSLWSTHPDVSQYESTAAIACAYDIYKAQCRCVTGLLSRTDILVQRAGLELLNAGVIVLETSFDSLNGEQSQLINSVINNGGLVLTVYPDQPENLMTDQADKMHQDINLKTILGAGGSILVSGGNSKEQKNVEQISCWLSVASATIDPEEIYAIMHDFTREIQDCCNFVLSDCIKYGVKPYVRYHLSHKGHSQNSNDANDQQKQPNNK